MNEGKMERERELIAYRLISTLIIDISNYNNKAFTT